MIDLLPPFGEALYSLSYSLLNFTLMTTKIINITDLYKQKGTILKLQSKAKGEDYEALEGLINFIEAITDHYEDIDQNHIEFTLIKETQEAI